MLGHHIRHSGQKNEIKCCNKKYVLFDSTITIRNKLILIPEIFLKKHFCLTIFGPLGCNRLTMTSSPLWSSGKVPSKYHSNHGLYMIFRHRKMPSKISYILNKKYIFDKSKRNNLAGIENHFMH